KGTQRVRLRTDRGTSQVTEGVSDGGIRHVVSPLSAGARESATGDVLEVLLHAGSTEAVSVYKQVRPPRDCRFHRPREAATGANAGTTGLAGESCHSGRAGAAASGAVAPARRAARPGESIARGTLSRLMMRR